MSWVPRRPMTHQVNVVVRNDCQCTKRCRKHGISEATFYYLWTAPPWQEGSDSGLTWSIANIYPASPDDGAPKWGIRSPPPRKVVGLEGHYKSQGLGVPERPVSPFSDPSRNLRQVF